MLNKALLLLSITVCLVAIAWGQSSIDERIKKEQDSLSNPNLPSEVKAVIQQRIARLQQAKIQAKTIEMQLQAAQQYRDSTPDLSSEDKATINTAINELQAQLNALVSGSASQGSSNPGSAPSEPVAKATSQAVTSHPNSSGNAAPSGPSQNVSVPQPPGAAAVGVCQTLADAKSVCTLTTAKLVAVTATSTIKTLAQVAASTVTKRKSGDPGDAFSTPAQRMAMFTILGAIDPDDAAKVSGDDLNLLQRKVNVKTETARTDKQLTAPGNNSGSTSPVVKPGIPTLLGIGLASGAVQQENTGTGLTLTTSPYSIAASLNGGDTDQNYRQYAAYQRLGIAATFDVQGQTNPDPTQVSRRQLENWAVRFRLTPDRSTRSEGFLQELKNHLDITEGLQAEPIAVSNLLRLLSPNDLANRQIVSAVNDFTFNTGWLTKLLLDNANLSNDKLEALLQEQILAHLQSDFIPQVADKQLEMDSQQLSTGLNALVSAQRARLQATKDFEALATSYSQQFEATLAYTNQYQLSQSPYSVISFLANKHAGTGMMFTFNAGVSLYQSPKPSLNQTTFRDFLTVFSMQQKLFRSPFLVNALNESPVTASLDGSYQYIHEYSGVKGKKVDIGTVTLKVDIPVAGGVSIPLSVTYATSPQLQVLKSSDYVQGNFGLSFDLDKLYTILNAPKAQ